MVRDAAPRDDSLGPTAAERLMKRSGVTFSRGGWSRAFGLEKDAAEKLAEGLRGLYYQVRHVGEAKGGKWEVTFR